MGLFEAKEFLPAVEPLCDRRVAQYAAVAHDDVALRITSDVELVCHHDDRDGALVEGFKHPHDLRAGAAVQVAGQLILSSLMSALMERTSGSVQLPRR